MDLDLLKLFGTLRPYGSRPPLFTLHKTQGGLFHKTLPGVPCNL